MRLNGETEKMIHRKYYGLVLLGIISIASATFADDSSNNVTYARDVAPIFQQRCQECHRPGNIAPMSLLTYEDIRPWAKSIKKSVAAKEMPPYHAERSPYRFANDISLTDDQISTIINWVDQGAMRGDLADMPKPVKFNDSEWKSGTPDLVLDSGFDYVVGGDVKDEYRCFVLSPGIEEDFWFQGIEYSPGNRKVVHHIMAYSDPKGVGRELDAEDPDPGFLCGMSGAGRGGINLNSLLGGWAPGTPPNIQPTGVAGKFPGGSDIIYQCHYHNETGEAQTDRSKMAFYFARDKIQATGKIAILGTFRLNIPAGEANAIHKAKWRASRDMYLHSLMPHMHFIGKAMKIDVTFPDGRHEVLLDVPRFDFNWQTVYGFEEPLLLPKGTQLDMVSVHDNSADNPDNPSSPPKDMYWGEATDEEMSHCWLNVVKANQDLNITPKPPVLSSNAGGGSATGGE